MKKSALISASLWLFILGYFALIAILAIRGQFIFMTQIFAIPIFLIAALLSRQFKRFLIDWSVFLALMIFLDTLRGIIYALIKYLNLPTYEHYVIAMEKFITFGHIAPHYLQTHWHLTAHSALSQFFAVLYGVHFIFFLLFGLLIWYYRRDCFWYFKTSFILITVITLIVYIAVPTVPPWMASAQGDIPLVQPLVENIYNIIAPLLFNVFNTDPIAAMPSLHAGFAAMNAIIAVHLFRWKGSIVVVYAILVDIACMALGAHYLTDILMGTLTAFITYFIVYYFCANIINKQSADEPTLLNHYIQHAVHGKPHTNVKAAVYNNIAIAVFVLILALTTNHLSQHLFKLMH